VTAVPSSPERDSSNSPEPASEYVESKADSKSSAAAPEAAPSPASAAAPLMQQLPSVGPSFGPVPIDVDSDHDDESKLGAGLSEFYPFNSWEESVLATFYVRNKIPRSELELLLRCLREPEFDTRKLPPSIDDLLTRIKKLPVPTVQARTVDILKRRKQKVEVVGAQKVFYFDILDILRRAFADPAIRQTLNLAPSEADPNNAHGFLDSFFARDPVSVAELVSFSFANAAGEQRPAMMCAFVTHDGGEYMFMTYLEFHGDGSLQLTGERWLSAADCKTPKLLDRELLRTPEIFSSSSESVTDLVGVFASQGGLKSSGAPDKCYWSTSQLGERRKRQKFDLSEHRTKLKRVLARPISIGDGKHIWIIIFLDGKQHIGSRFNPL